MIEGGIQLWDQAAQATRFCTVGIKYLMVFSTAPASPLAPKIFSRLENFLKICVHLQR